MNYPTSSTASILNSPKLRPVLEKIEKHRAILSQVREALPAALAEHCMDCVTRENRLVLYVDTPSWSFQLRFYLPAIRSKLKVSEGYEFRDIQVRNLVQQRPLTRSHADPVVSQSTLSSIHASASETSTEELRSALTRLAETLGQRISKTDVKPQLPTV